jgi:VWFA-related protein
MPTEAKVWWIMRVAGVLLLFSGMLALPPGPFAQSVADGVPAALPTFKANTTNVLVDVVVTDSHNKPVNDLTQDSFTVLENGHPQQIVSFEAYPSPTAIIPAPLPALPAGVYTNAQAVAGNNTVDVLLIDALNTSTVNQAESHQMLLAYLKTLPVNKPVAVFTLDTRLRQLEDFTTDHTALLKAVEDFARLPRKSPLLKTAQDTEKQMKDEDDAYELSLAAHKPAMGKTMMLQLKKFSAEQESFNISLRVQYTLSALDQLARYLSGMPGRKNVLWLSGSFPLAVLPNPELNNPYQAARDFSEAVDHTASLLAKARVAVYPIDARGLFPQSLSAPSMSGGGFARTPDRVNAAESADSSLHAEERLTLDEVAHVTGGEAIANTNDLKSALQEVDRNGTHYYTLTYVPSNKSQDNKVRTIEVRVHPGKYRLSYRRSYVAAPTPPKGDTFSILLQHDIPASAQILFRLSPTRIAVQPASAPIAGSNPNPLRPVTRYSIGYDVDVAPLELVASPDGILHGSTTLVVIAYDRDGRPLNSTSNTLNLNVPSVEYPRFIKEGIHYRQQLDIPTQTAWLRAGILDHTSGNVGSLEVPFSVSVSPSSR